jgi:hypothetical protein
MGIHERFRTFWRVCWISPGFVACEVVFVLAKRSALCVPHTTTSQILFTYKAALNAICCCFLALFLMTHSKLLSSVSTEASHRRFCRRSNATDTTHFCFRWLSPSVLTVLTEFRINRNRSVRQSKTRSPNATSFGSRSLIGL